MEIDIDDDSNVVIEQEDDIETQLQHIAEYDNAKQLELLKREINHIVIHNITPSEGWFDERFKYVHTYSKLDWADLAQRFHSRDSYIYGNAMGIIHSLSEIMEEYSMRPNFHLTTYYNAITLIYQVWNYYHRTYMGDETDDDVVDLIEKIRFM